MGDEVFAAFCDAPDDASCVDAVVAVLHRLILGCVLSMRGSEEQFEEIANETILVLMDEIADREMRDFEAVKRFTYVVVRHRFLNLVRSDRRYRQALERLESQAPASAADPESVVAALGILEVLAELDPESHRLLHYRLIEGRSFAEIAQILGIAEGAARTRWHRATEKARNLIGLGGAPRGR